MIFKSPNVSAIYWPTLWRLITIGFISFLFITNTLYADLQPTSTKNFDLIELQEIPINLYDHIGILKSNTPALYVNSIKQDYPIFQPNITKDSFDKELTYWTKFIIGNSSSESKNIFINFSSNNWNESWDIIDAFVYNNDSLITKIKTGNLITKTAKPIRSVQNLLKLVIAPGQKFEVYTRLENKSKASENHASHINFSLLLEKEVPGLIEGYPFEGTFPLRHAYTPFRAHHLINHELYIATDSSMTVDAIARSWSSLAIADIFNTDHKINTVYWMKIQLIGSPKFNGRQIFQISKAPVGTNGLYKPALGFYSFDYIDGYYKDSEGNYVHQRSGDHVAIKDRPLKLWGTFLTIDVPPNDTIDYYIRMEGADRRFLMSEIVLYHIDPTSIYPRQINEGWIHGLFYGALGIHLLFFFMLYLIEREQLYFYFSIVILGLMMINLFPEDIYSRYVVFPSWRDWHVPLYFMGTLILGVGIIKFTEKYFLISSRSVISKRIIPIIITIHAVIAIYLSFTFEYDIIYGNPLRETPIRIFIAIQICSLILPIIIAIIAKKKKSVSKLFYMISFSPLIIVGIIHLSKIVLYNSFEQVGFENPDNISERLDLIKISVATMLTFFAISVGFRSNRVKADKEQAQQLAEQSAIIEIKSKQNETLLKEIHHRVKNNLQTISSLLYLQSYGEKNEKTKENIAITQQRVESIALIHKNLYQRDNLAAIEMKAYIRELAESLVSAYQKPDKTVILKIDIPTFELDIDRAIPMGLIINEILTNSLKYAFHSVSKGELIISLITSENYNKTLLIADNGIGKSEESIPSFGSQLIQLLTKQINATITSGNDNGHWIRMTWNDDV